MLSKSFEKQTENYDLQVVLSRKADRNTTCSKEGEGYTVG